MNYFLLEDYENIREENESNAEEFLALKKQLSDVEKFKKAFNAKVKSNVSFSDIEELQKILNQLNISYKEYEIFYKEIFSKFWGKGKDDYWSSEGAKLLRDYKDKSLEKYKPLHDKIESNLEDLVHKNKDYLELENIKNNAYNSYMDIKEKNTSELDKLKLHIIEKYSKNLLNLDSGAIWVLYYCINQETRIKRQRNSWASYWYGNYRTIKIQIDQKTFFKLNDLKNISYVKESLSKMLSAGYNKFEDRIKELSSICEERKLNPIYDDKFNKWLNYTLNNALQAIRLLEKMFEEYKQEESSKLEFQNKAKDNYYNSLQQVRDLEKELKSAPEYLELKKKYDDLHNKIFYDRFNYTLLWNQKAVDEIINRRYLRYLIQECLNPYIKKLEDNLSIIKGRYGIGKGTGTALTNFRNIKDRINNSLPEIDKAYFIGWLCKHLRYMMVNVMPDGASEKVFNILFPEIHNYNTSAKTYDNAWDSRAGQIKIDSYKNLNPKIQELFNKVTSTKATLSVNNIDDETGKFSGNTLNSVDLVYFLLNEFYAYGFHLGNININSEEAAELQEHKFNNYKNEFYKGYNS